MSAHPTTDICLLFDNGSLEPAATLALRGLAARLEETIGVEVRPVSLLHSSTIDSSRLENRPAELLEPTLRALLASGRVEVTLVPLFFGPSAALTEYVPARLARLRREFPESRVHFGRWLVDVADPGDTRIAAVLADQVRAVIAAARLRRPAVVVVDHGSPQRAVGAVRDHLGRQVERLLGGAISRLAVASMERRAGAAYDFCDPTLARLLEDGAWPDGETVLAPAFLLPGRHAGPGGDLARICAAAAHRRPGLRVHVAELVGRHPGLVPVLADRYREIAGPAGAAVTARASARSNRSPAHTA